MQKLKKSFIIIVLLSFILMTDYYVFANGGPTSEGPSESSSIIFDENSNISLVEETVLFNQIEENYSEPTAKVSINYKLENMDESEKDFKIFFVVPSQSSDFSITMNDIDITKSCEYKEIPIPYNWIPSSSSAIFNPENGDVLSSYHESGYLSKTWGVEIPISINSNEYSILNVEYTSIGGFYRGDEVKQTVYGFMYYLTPAKFWNGTPKVTLKVKLPSNDTYSFYSNIPLEEVENGYYEAQITDIPDREWLFSYNSKAGLIYGANNPGIHLKINIVVTLLIYGVFALLSKHFKRRWLKIIGYIFSVFFFFGFTGKITDGYLGDAIIYFLLFLLLVIIVPTSYFISRYLIKRNEKRGVRLK